jgi:hypothetical protein
MQRNFYDETNYIPLGLKNLYRDEFLYPTPSNSKTRLFSASAPKRGRDI